MAKLNQVSIAEQNANTLAGVQVTSATYVGTNITADLVIRWNREAPVVKLNGTQTASMVYIQMDTVNATHGAAVTICRHIQVTGTSILNVFSGAVGTGYAAGTAIATIPASQNGQVTVSYNGITNQWI